MANAPSKRLARIAGALFIAATVTSLIASGFLDSVITDTGSLAKLSGHHDQVIAGASFQLLAAFSCAGIGIALYPAVRRVDPGLAIGSAGFRIIEGTLYVVAAVGTLLLLELAQEQVGAGDPAAGYFQTTGALLRTLRDDATVAGLLAFYVGSSLYYLAFYRSALVPRWLAAWGLAGVALGAVAAVCVLLQLTAIGSTFQLGLNIPIGIQEMVLALWLMLNGFSTRAAPAPRVEAGASIGA